MAVLLFRQKGPKTTLALAKARKKVRNLEFDWSEGKLFGTMVHSVCETSTRKEVLVDCRNLAEADGHMPGHDCDAVSLRAG